ncbi:MAG: hypothetical protein WAK57_04370 [Desulfobacterales bacterium]
MSTLVLRAAVVNGRGITADRHIEKSHTNSSLLREQDSTTRRKAGGDTRRFEAPLKF